MDVYPLSTSLFVIPGHSGSKEFVIGAALHRPVLLAQMHGTAPADIPYLARCALVAPHPVPVAELPETVVPYIHKTVGVDIPLVETASDAQTSRNCSIIPY